METASDVITDALKEIAALPAESTIPADKAQTGIFYLNAMMGDFAVKGINLGYTYVDDLSDFVTVDEGAIESIVKNLAVELTPVYGDTLTSQTLLQQAIDGYKSLQQIAIDSPSSSPYPDRLPVGSGNGSIRRNDFYDSPSDPILTEGGGYIREG
jgi:hypothetical protein